MQSRITVAKMPPVMTTVPAVIRPPLHQQPATHVAGLTASALPRCQRYPFWFRKLRKHANGKHEILRGRRAGGGRRETGGGPAVLPPPPPAPVSTSVPGEAESMPEPSPGGPRRFLGVRDDFASVHSVLGVARSRWTAPFRPGRAAHAFKHLPPSCAHALRPPFSPKEITLVFPYHYVSFCDAISNHTPLRNMTDLKKKNKKTKPSLIVLKYTQRKIAILTSFECAAPWRRASSEHFHLSKRNPFLFDTQAVYTLKYFFLSRHINKHFYS